MSEIKGQLLGIVLVLVIFGAVSAALATVFTQTTQTITQKSEAMADDVEELMSVNDTPDNPN